MTDDRACFFRSPPAEPSEEDLAIVRGALLTCEPGSLRRLALTESLTLAEKRLANTERAVQRREGMR